MPALFIVKSNFKFLYPSVPGVYKQSCLTTICSATILSYNSVEQKDLQPVFEVLVISAAVVTWTKFSLPAFMTSFLLPYSHPQLTFVVIFSCLHLLGSSHAGEVPQVSGWEQQNRWMCVVLWHYAPLRTKSFFCTVLSHAGQVFLSHTSQGFLLCDGQGLIWASSLRVWKKDMDALAQKKTLASNAVQCSSEQAKWQGHLVADRWMTHRAEMDRR